MDARLILQQSFTPSVQYIMDRFHWLPMSTRIDFKIATLTYNTLSSGHPAYLRELISPYQPSRSLRSSSQLLLTVPRAYLTIGQRAFCHSSPSIWNSIPLSAREAPSNSTVLLDGASLECTVSTFKRRLKSFYFNSLIS